MESKEFFCFRGSFEGILQVHSDTKGGNQVILERVLDPKMKTILQWYSLDLQKRLRIFKRFVSVGKDFLESKNLAKQIGRGDVFGFPSHAFLREFNRLASRTCHCRTGVPTGVRPAPWRSLIFAKRDVHCLVNCAR